MNPPLWVWSIVLSMLSAFAPPQWLRLAISLIAMLCMIGWVIQRKERNDETEASADDPGAAGR